MHFSQRIAIIGGGFSGVMTLWHLTRQPQPLDIRLYAEPHWLGFGLAYGTNDSCHLLNVPAARMGALSHAVGHFYDWAAAQPAAWRGLAPSYATLPLTPDSFLPRQIYGKYLQTFLTEAQTSPSHRVEIVATPATGLVQAGGVVSAAGAVWPADTVILATGPMLAQPFAFPAHPGVLATPWGAGLAEFWAWYGRQAWGVNSRLALLGTGLTAVDMVLSLAARGFPGQIIALSRQGDWPAAHDLAERPVPWPDGAHPETAAGLRQAFETAFLQAGGNWRGVIDGCRPVINALWVALPEGEKANFLKDSFSWWNVRRHRMPESSALMLAELAAAGRLVTRAARVTGVDALPAGELAVALADGEALPVDGVISTLGFSFDIRQAAAPLWQDLLRQGFVQPGPAGLGVAVTDDYVAFAGNGWRLLTLGQSLFGARFETTAVPELRVQAAEVAALSF